jgi:hypothetical protein
MAEATLPLLPTSEELDAAVEAIFDALSKVDSIRHRLYLIDRHYMDEKGPYRGPIPTFEDLGLIWDYQESLELQAREIKDAAQNISEVLDTLNEIRREDKGV